MFKIIDRSMLVPNIHSLTIHAPDVARQVKAGQFVILMADDEGERIPLTISDWEADKGCITVIFMNIGKTTGKLASLTVGDEIPVVVGPLGNPMEIDHFGTVMLVGGCYGIGSIYPIARELKRHDNRVIIIIEARSSYLVFWMEKLRNISDSLVVITRDGTEGIRGHINRLEDLIPKFGIGIDRIIANGCNFLMMRVCQSSRSFGIKTMVSLNTLMIDGTGMCGVCRVTVGGTTKFACVDGPHFNGHEVDWQELNRRRKAYLHEEMLMVQSSAADEVET